MALFAGAKEFAEKQYGHELEARAHATWAQSPTCDFWQTGEVPRSPRKYEYTPDFLLVEHRPSGRVRLRRLLRVE